MVSSGARRVHPWLGWLFAAAVLVQVFLAGLALFSTTGFGPHIEFGYTGIGLIALAVLVAALVGRLPRVEIGLTVLLFVLYVVQTALPNLRSTAPVVAALHPVNAFALFSLAVVIARRSGRLATAPTADARPAP